MKFGFVGLGLIGGSVARAIRESIPDAVIVAYDTYGPVLDSALSEGIINKASYEIDNNFNNCDFIFLCAPVTGNEDNLKKIIEHVDDNTILTDVGSVKGNIHKALDSVNFNKCFIGGHPMAGSEKYGFENSDSAIIKGAFYILTPGKYCNNEQINKYSSLISSIGCKPTILDYEKHDRSTGVISHIPHVISASLVHFLINQDDDEKTMKMLAAGGFRDITRTASSSVKMWEDICITNSDIICDLLDDYIDELKEIRETIKSKDKAKVAKFFSEAKEYRDFLYVK